VHVLDVALADVLADDRAGLVAIVRWRRRKMGDYVGIRTLAI
jgi:hypothetical protein